MIEPDSLTARGCARLRSVLRLADPTPHLVGSSLISLGLVLLGYAVAMYLDVVPGGRVSVPPPVALERSRLAAPAASRSSLEPPAATTAVTSSVEQPPAAGLAAPAPAVHSELIDADADLLVALATPDPAAFKVPAIPADAADRPFWGSRPPPGLAVGLRIPSIKVSTKVVSAGVVKNARGELEWETVPFVAAHYADTSPAGARGNAVISGHVVTLYEGNVFRNLYRAEFGQLIEVETADGVFTYEIDDIRLVSPGAVEVMAPTADARVTLITCGGEFNPRTTQFSHRLIVGGRLADWARHPGA